MILNSPYVTGSLTVTGNITASGGITISGSISSASYSANADRLDNLDSTSFVFTSSYNTDSASVSTRVSKIEGNYATTGSNIFTGAQTVCANITSTGTIIAQTLNVQQVTSSIVYSSGSNTFGCQLTDVQQMTGSVRITGSLNTIGIACFSNVVCTPQLRVSSTGDLSYIYNSGASTTDANFYIYSATKDILMVRNSGCIGIGTANPTKALEIVSNTSQDGIKISGTSNPRLTIVDTTNSVQFDALTTDTEVVLRSDTNHPLHLSTNGTLRLNITNTGIACFSCQVCAPNVSIVNCLGVGTAAGAGYILDVYQPASSTTAYARIKNNRTRNAALQLETNCGNYLVGVGIGTDTNRLMIYDNNAGATRLTLDQCGNVGLGTTPAAWVSTARAFQINAYNSIASQHNGSFNIISEAYESAANTFAYGSTGGYPTRINMNPNDGVISIFNAPTGTAGNTITWCERMRIRSAGEVLIGSTGIYGGTDNNESRLLVVGNPPSTDVDRGLVSFMDARAYNTSGLGAKVMLGGKYNTAGDITFFAGLAGLKENTTDGNYAGALAFYTRANGAGSCERMRITSGGDVGIGTTSINSNVKLKVKATSEGSGISTSSATFVIARSATDTQLGIGYYTTPGAWVISSTYGSDGAYQPLAFATSDVERMRITSGGNVGIGTASPCTTLTVEDANKAFPLSYNSGYGNVHIQTNETTATQNFGGSLTFGGLGRTSGPTEKFIFAAIAGRKESTTSGDPKGYLQFSTLSDDTNQIKERMRITSCGLFKLQNMGVTYESSTAGVNEIGTCANDTNMVFRNVRGSLTGARAGIDVFYAYAQPNSADASFYEAADSTDGSTRTLRFKVASNGTVYARSTSITLISSDCKLKTDVVDYDKGLSEVISMKPRYFKYKDDLSQTHSGFIAQEMNEALPGSMIQSYVDQDCSPVMTYQVDWYPLLVNAIKQQHCTICTQATRINLLESCLGLT